MKTHTDTDCFVWMGKIYLEIFFIGGSIDSIGICEKIVRVCKKVLEFVKSYWNL